jgi:hypothetical protein
MTDGTLPPALFPGDYPWRVAAISPAGRQLGIRVTRGTDNPYVWNGTIRFPSRGSWQVCVLNLSGTGRSCVAHGLWWQRIPVRPKSARVDTWQRLERPFHIPTIATGSTCPTSAPDSKGDLGRIGFAGTAWGAGPAYPAGLDSGEGKPVFRYLDPIPPESGFYGSDWFGEKVLWIVDPVYQGPVLIRGLQVDGPNDVRFDSGMLPPRAIKVDVPTPSPSVRWSRASYTRVRAPGCYAYQIDGLSFSSVLIFEARPFS